MYHPSLKHPFYNFFAIHKCFSPASHNESHTPIGSALAHEVLQSLSIACGAGCPPNPLGLRPPWEGVGLLSP